MQDQTYRTVMSVDFDFEVEADGSLKIRTVDRELRVQSTELREFLQAGGHLEEARASDAHEHGSATRRRALKAMVELGLAFQLGEQASRSLATDADHQLFTYFARRSKQAEQKFSAFKESVLAVVGHPSLARLLRSDLLHAGVRAAALSRQQLVATLEAGERPTVLVVCTGSDTDALLGLGRELARWKLDWVPAVFAPQHVSLGPWCRPGQSACVECEQSVDGPRGELLEAGFSGAARELAWRTTQPHCRAWIAGVIATQFEGLAWPVGEVSHWGRRTTLRIGEGTQSCTRVWRAPWCAACGVPAAPPQRWCQP